MVFTNTTDIHKCHGGMLVYVSLGDQLLQIPTNKHNSYVTHFYYQKNVMTTYKRPAAGSSNCGCFCTEVWTFSSELEVLPAPSTIDP